MTTFRAHAKAILGVAAVALWGLAPGCGASIGSYCDKACDCIGCNDSEHDDCIDDLEDARKAAQDESCGDKFNDILSCYDSELTCDDGDLDVDGCESESEALEKCLEDTVFGGSGSGGDDETSGSGGAGGA